MRKIVYSILMSFAFLFIISCSSVEKNNHIIPIISEIRFNENMKISYIADSVNNIIDTLIINSSSKSIDEIDTLLIDYPITLSGVFESENGLSNIRVKIWGDTMNITPVDTCFNITRVPVIYNMFGNTFFEIYNTDVYSKIPYTMPTAQGGFKTIRTGEEYFYNISCIDKLGNINNESFNKKPIRILTLQEMINNKTVKNKYSEL